MKVLVVEDARHLRQAIVSGLRRGGYAVDGAGDGAEGLWFAESNDYDVVVLDIMLPEMDGLTVLRRLREKGNRTHVLLLTAKDAVEDRVRGLQAGADDYLVKPFAFAELLARIQALCRRRYGQKSPLISVGDLEIDTASKMVRRAGAPIELKPREYALLEYLALRQGEVVSRSEIEAHLYDEQADPMSNVVDSAICTLRRKLGTPPIIHTRHGHGYVLSADAT